MKNSNYSKSNRKSKLAELKIVNPDYLQFQIGDRVCVQSFTTDKSLSYSSASGHVHGYVYISPKVLDVDGGWSQTGWFYAVLFDETVNESKSSYFEFLHESDVFSPGEMPRWDDPLFLIRFLIQSITHKFLHR